MDFLLVLVVVLYSLIWSTIHFSNGVVLARKDCSMVSMYLSYSHSSMNKVLTICDLPHA